MEWRPGRKWIFAIWAAVFACSFLSTRVRAGAQADPLPDLITAGQIKLEEFEPAVRDQISRAYDEARKKPQDAAAAGRLGMLFQVYGKYEFAESCYLRARALDPRSSRWPYYLGIVEKSLGKNEQAIRYTRESLSIDSNYAPGKVRLAQLLFDAGDADRSAEIYRSVISQNKRMATAYFGLGQVLASKGDWPAAIESYLRACEIAENYAAAHYALGMAYRNAGDLAKAKEHLQRSQTSKQAKQPSEDPLMNDVNSLYSGGLTRFAIGSTLYQQGKLQEAIQEFEGALEVNPRMVSAHINLIALYGQLNQADKAEQHFKAAVDLDPGWVEVYYNWGMFLVQHGRQAQAAEMFQKAVEINPSYPEAQVQLALLLDESGRSKEAAAHYERALEVNPSHRQAHYFYARSLLRNGRIQEAIQHLLETIKVEDTWTPVCMQALAVAYERGGNRERAIFYLQQARQRAASSGSKDLASQLQRDIERLSTEAARP